MADGHVGAVGCRFPLLSCRGTWRSHARRTTTSSGVGHRRRAASGDLSRADCPRPLVRMSTSGATASASVGPAHVARRGLWSRSERHRHQLLARRRGARFRGTIACQGVPWGNEWLTLPAISCLQHVWHARAKYCVQRSTGLYAGQSESPAIYYRGPSRPVRDYLLVRDVPPNAFGDQADRRVVQPMCSMAAPCAMTTDCDVRHGVPVAVTAGAT